MKWGVKAIDEKEQYFYLYAIKMTNRDGTPALGGDVVTDANADFVQQAGRSEQQVSMTMNAEGAKAWARLTKENIGKAVAIVLDDMVYSAPNVQVEITGGRSQITGHFTPEEAKDLANVLKSGKMAASVHIVQEDVVGPSLGQEAINSGVISICFGFDPVDVLHVCLLRSSSGLDRRRCFGIEHLFHNGYPCILPGSPYVAGYCRYGVDAGYGCRCQRVDLRTYERGTSCR